jgi:hypothetical protein
MVAEFVEGEQLIGRLCLTEALQAPAGLLDVTHPRDH